MAASEWLHGQIPKSNHYHMTFQAKTHQLNIPSGVQRLEGISLSLSLRNIPLKKKTGSQGQFGTGNLLREKLNVFSPAINIILWIEYRAVGVRWRLLSNMTLSSQSERSLTVSFFCKNTLNSLNQPFSHLSLYDLQLSHPQERNIYVFASCAN